MPTKKHTKASAKPNSKSKQERRNKRANGRDIVANASKKDGEQFTGETKLVATATKLEKQTEQTKPEVRTARNERPAAPEQGVNRDSF